MEPLKIGLIGFGNIGAGVMRTLEAQRALHEQRLARPMRIVRIADRDTTTQRDAPYDPAILSDDVDGLLADPEVQVVIELVGGEEPARTFVEAALHNGKHVVTANKALLALHGPELLALARERGVGLLYEAAVGGGIPIIRALQQGLAANSLTNVQGILNGTCNYILTRMASLGESFDTVLAKAKAKGYAEPDPTYDIEGYDTAHKIAILASMAFGMDIRFGDVHVEGITQVAQTDLNYAAELGYAIKLLGIAKREEPEGPVEVRVHPTLLPKDSPLGSVNGVFNAVRVDGEPIGPTLFYGQGAGPSATSSAVVSDLMALAADSPGFNGGRDDRLTARVGFKQLRPMEDLISNYYIRFTVADQPGTMARLGLALADEGVSIESMIQHRSETDEERGTAVLTIVTHETREGNLQTAIQRIEEQAISHERPFILRVEE